MTANDLVGGYTIVSGEKHGDAIPADRIQGTTVRITETAIVVTDKDKKDVYANTYTLDASTVPARIMLTSKLAPSEGQVAEGLIEQRGDTLRLIYALPGAAAPADFRTKPGQLMFVMTNRNR